MIRCVAAIDVENGFANLEGIPWNIPTDKRAYRDLIKHDVVLMGHNTYTTHPLPLSDMPNFVLSYDDTLREGYFPVKDIDRFMQMYHKSLNVSIIGGESVFRGGLKWCDSLFLTIVEGGHDCIRFFPDFRQDFRLVDQSDPIVENGDTYTFTRWDRI